MFKKPLECNPNPPFLQEGLTLKGLGGNFEPSGFFSKNLQTDGDFSKIILAIPSL